MPCVGDVPIDAGLQGAQAELECQGGTLGHGYISVAHSAFLEPYRYPNNDLKVNNTL
ncbi:MAG: hypothetical protein V7742_21210 [Halioglobus sp.]